MQRNSFKKSKVQKPKILTSAMSIIRIGDVIESDWVATLSEMVKTLRR